MKNIKLGLAALIAMVASFGLLSASFLTGRDLHIDVPLSNLSIAPFTNGDYVAQQLFPIVPVGKQSNLYFTIDKGAWLRLPQSTLRAPGAAPRRVEWKVSSDAYIAKNYALAGQITDEDRANADDQIMLEQNTTLFVSDMLARDLEVRIANKVSSISNVGSGVVLAGGNKWSNLAGSSPLSDVTTAVAFIRANTGVIANTAVIDWDTLQILRRHPELLDLFKYTSGGELSVDQIKSAFNVKNVLVPSGIKNTANENAAASLANIWPNICLICYVNPAPIGPKTATFGLGFRWTSDQLGVPMAVRRYREADEGKKTDVIDVQYYQDEKIVAAQLAYGITATI